MPVKVQCVTICQSVRNMIQMMQIVQKMVKLLNWLISAFDIFISHVFQFLKRLLVLLELAMTEGDTITEIVVVKNISLF